MAQHQDLTPMTPTGNPRVDAALRAVITSFEERFPRRVLAYYLEGSHGDGTDLPTSDLDLTIVIRDRFAGSAERGAFEHLRSVCAQAAPLELDLEFDEEATLRQGASPTLKLGSRCVSGRDTRDAWPLVPLDVWTRDRMHTSYWRIIQLFARPVPVSLPLTYPNHADEFYGYLVRPTHLSNGTMAPGTRDLIRATSWAATALCALQAGRYIARKSECHLVYREAIGDAWSDLLADLYRLCRQEWHYLIPTDASPRASLRALCERVLGFENHFLAIYRDYLISELRAAPDTPRRHALEVLGMVSLLDPAVRAVVSAIATREADPLAGLAAEALQLRAHEPEQAE